MKYILAKLRRVVVCQRRHLMIKIRKRIPHQWFLRFPRLYSRMVYASAFGTYPNLNKPSEICELLMKLNIEALSDSAQKELRILCADKVAVRNYVESKGLKEILNPIYGVYDNINDVDFDKLPNQFVLKTNFSCGQNLIVKDKTNINIEATKELFNKWMSQPNEELLEYGEWHYTQIPRKILAEKYLSELGEAISVVDYKFQCFKGKVYGCFVGTDRTAHDVSFSHYDNYWNFIPGIKAEYNKNNRIIEKPKNLDRMIEIAEILSSDFPYCRVDLYSIDNQILFGEMTFTPAGNTMTYYNLWIRKDMFKFYIEN